jgi:DNA-binding transcriptional regulator YhcF (GntR family)
LNIQNWRTALIESEMTDKAKLVGLVLSVYWNNKGKIYPSLTTLENDCSLTKNTIIRAVTELTDNNFVTVTKEHHRKSSFKINTYSLTGVTIAPMNDTVNAPMIDRANEPSIDSVATAPMNAPELDIKVFKGIKEKDTIVSKKKVGETGVIEITDAEFEKLKTKHGDRLDIVIAEYENWFINKISEAKRRNIKKPYLYLLKWDLDKYTKKAVDGNLNIFSEEELNEENGI